MISGLKLYRKRNYKIIFRYKILQFFTH